jgi:hypothetical protein
MVPRQIQPGKLHSSAGNLEDVTGIYAGDNSLPEQVRPLLAIQRALRM